MAYSYSASRSWRRDTLFLNWASEGSSPALQRGASSPAMMGWRIRNTVIPTMRRAPDDHHDPTPWAFH